MESHTLEVLGSRVHYVEEGDGGPVVFLHGNPTSSYIWRNVIPRVSNEARCLAPDLIGFGRSDKPDIDYRFVDHARYLDGWFDALDLWNVVLVLHDWGSALGFHWAARHRDRVAGLAFVEPILKTRRWDDLTNETKRKTFEQYRTPGVGERMLIEENFFIEKWLPRGVVRSLSDEEMEAYRAPFTNEQSRVPIWRWPQEIPFDGEPPDVTRIVDDYSAWLRTDPTPKLLLVFEPGSIMDLPMIEWATTNLAALEIAWNGSGVHFVQEDHPEWIGDTIAEWRRRAVTSG